MSIVAICIGMFSPKVSCECPVILYTMNDYQLTLMQKLCESIKTGDELIHVQSNMFVCFSKKYEELQPPDIIEDLINGGALKPEQKDGKYITYHQTMDLFIAWIFENNYGDIPPAFISENIWTERKADYSLETIKRLMREYRDTQ